MNKKFILTSVLVIISLVLAGCQTSQVANAAPQRAQGTPPASFNPRQAAAASATPTASATAAPTATATVQPVTAKAESAAWAYFTALQKEDFSTASQLVSIFSLSFAEMTRSDAASQLSSLSQAGTTWSDLQVVDSQAFSDSVILVHVTYRTGTTAAATATATAAAKASATQAAVSNQKDELWPFRLENGQWLYNWNNLIDYQTLVVQSQVREHITIKPSQLVRYSDRIELHFMMQNQTSDVVYFVQAYDSLAVFHFGEQEVEADKTRSIVISGLRTSFDEVIVVKGLYSSFPNWVEIRKWKGYAPNPWYSFQF